MSAMDFERKGLWMKLIGAAALMAVVPVTAVGQGPSKNAVSEPEAVSVTVDNFIRAETDMYFGRTVKVHSFDKFAHSRELTPLDKQVIVRMNRDTLYSGAVFDLDAGQVTITLPDAGKRFMSMQVINEDHFTSTVFYNPGSYTFARGKAGTRYVEVVIRTLVDPSSLKDLDQVHALQEAVKVDQASPGRFEIPNWDATSQKKVRDALSVLGTTLPDSKKMFGTREQVDPVRHSVGTAVLWGGNPE